MSRQLIILRHGKSDWSLPVSDFKRPLKARGAEEAQAVGEWLFNDGLVPEYVLCSPAERAHQTAAIVCECMQLPGDDVYYDDTLYMASIEEWLEAMAVVPTEIDRLMIVGHNPGLEELLLFLLHEDDYPEDNKLLPTATMALLELDCDWDELEPECAGLLEIKRGKLL